MEHETFVYLNLTKSCRFNLKLILGRWVRGMAAVRREPDQPEESKPGGDVR